MCVKRVFHDSFMHYLGIINYLVYVVSVTKAHRHNTNLLQTCHHDVILTYRQCASLKRLSQPDTAHRSNPRHCTGHIAKC